MLPASSERSPRHDNVCHSVAAYLVRSCIPLSQENRSVQSSGMYSPVFFSGVLHAPLTIRQLSVSSSQGYLFPSKPLSFNTCKYTKAVCFCQGIYRDAFTTYRITVIIKILFQTGFKDSHTPFSSKSLAAFAAPSTIPRSYSSISRSRMAFREVARPFFRI